MSSMSPTAFDQLVKQEIYPVVFESYEAQPLVHPLIFRRLDDTAATLDPYGYKTTTLANVGDPHFRKDGEDIKATRFQEGWPVYLKTRLLSEKIEIPERLMEKMDEKGLGAYLRDRTGTWGKAFADRKERLAADMFNKGPLTAGDLDTFDQTFDDGSQVDPYPTVSYDGVPYFDTAHPLKTSSSTTFSNHRASSTLSATTLDTARTLIEDTNAYDERNRRIRMAADTLVVPAALRGLGRRLLNSELLPGGAQNDINPNSDMSLVVWRYLTDSDSWFLGQRGGGITYWDQGAPVLRTSFDEDKKMFKIVAESRFICGPSDWRNWVANNIAAA